VLKPYFDTGAGLGRPLGDQECLALLRQLLRENKTTIAQSQAAIVWTRDAIALLDRLVQKKRAVVVS
jgi:hypothetical protein